MSKPGHLIIHNPCVTPRPHGKSNPPQPTLDLADALRLESELATATAPLHQTIAGLREQVRRLTEAVEKSRAAQPSAPPRGKRVVNQAKSD